MTIRKDHLTNEAYGFPRGHRRTIPCPVLCVIHITSNDATAQNERDFANRPGNGAPGQRAASAHYYIDRDGDGIEAIDPVAFAAWSNGAVRSPNTSNVGVRRLLDLRDAGHNVNEGCLLEVECVGVATSAGQITGEQIDTVARLIAAQAKRTGLPINRATVLTHADIDSETRSNCAFLPARREIRMAELIARANAILHPLPPAAPGWIATVRGRTPLYNGANAVVGHVSLATYRTAERVKMGRAWRYRIIRLASGKPTANAGKYLPATSTVKFTRP